MKNILFYKKYIVVAIGVLGIFFFGPIHAFAATNISATSSQHWAWNDEIGWIDFYTPNTANVVSNQLTGYASSSAGYISLDCATSPSGNICAKSNYQVSNDGAGNLSGWAWNDTYGWVSFCGNSSGGASTLTGTSTWVCPSVPTYEVTVSPTTGVFTGWAWNDVIGWVDFNCANVADNICSTSNFETAASWTASSTFGTLDSETFDTGVASGSEINSITWVGSTPAGTAVGFQLAVSNSSSGPWNFAGPDGTSATIYSGISGVPIILTQYSSLIGRYFRYRAILTTNIAKTISPVVNDVMVNWSP